jgi:DivIVA domain-containing protein
MTLLTADDIRYRKFAPTRFREGYDVDEVDDFLEEVIQTVEELTRLAQGAATNTGSFSAVRPSDQEINRSPVVVQLRNDKSALETQVSQLEHELNLAKSNLQNSQAMGGASSDSEKDAKLQELLKDNQDLVVHLRNAEERITSLQEQVRVSQMEATQMAPVGQVPNDGEAQRKLDELTAQLTSLQAEYNSARNANAGLEQQIERLQQTSGANSGEVEVLKLELEQIRGQLDESNAHVARLQVRLQSAESPESGSLSAIGAAAGTSSNQAAAMLSMAQQLHDEYVQKGKNEAARLTEDAQVEYDRLVRTGQSEHDRLLEEAKTQNKRILEEANNAADETYETLARERTKIEKRIDELRIFEKDYRNKLSKTLHSLLNDFERGSIIEEPGKD